MLPASNVDPDRSLSTRKIKRALDRGPKGFECRAPHNLIHGAIYAHKDRRGNQVVAAINGSESGLATPSRRLVAQESELTGDLDVLWKDFKSPIIYQFPTRLAPINVPFVQQCDNLPTARFRARVVTQRRYKALEAIRHAALNV
jgi:hypothetical protein